MANVCYRLTHSMLVKAFRGEPVSSEADSREGRPYETGKDLALITATRTDRDGGARRQALKRAVKA